MVKTKRGGETCSTFNDDCRQCLNYRFQWRSIPRNRARGLGVMKDKTCLYNLETGKCRQPTFWNLSRRHGHNDWTKNPDHCVENAQIVPHGIPEALPVSTQEIYGDVALPYVSGRHIRGLDHIVPAGRLPEAEATEIRENVCTRAMEAVGECVISGGRRKTKRRRRRKTRKTRKKKRRRKKHKRRRKTRKK